MGRDRTILIVDEMQWFRDLGALFLARSGRVLAAGSVARAQEIVMGVLQAHSAVLGEPRPMVLVEQLAVDLARPVALVALIGGRVDQRAQEVQLPAEHQITAGVARRVARLWPLLTVKG